MPTSWRNRFTPGMWKEFKYSSIAFLSYVFVGCGRSYTSFLFEQLQAPGSTIELTNSRKSWIASLPYLFNPVGCLISGAVSDIYGRKICVQSVFVLFILSWLINGVAQDIQTIYFGMVVQGIAGGMSFSISAYISEISAVENRGFLLSIIEPMFASGIALSSILMYFFPWNYVSIFYAFLGVIGLLLSAIICESPVWLFYKDRTEKSIEVLQSLRGQDRLLLENEIKEMENFYHKQTRSYLSIMRDMFKAWRMFVMLTILYILEQTGGYLLILSYTLIFFDSLQMPFDSSVIVIVYSVCGFIASLITPFFVQRYNRKTVLTVSTIGMGVCMLAVSIYEQIYLEETNKPFVWMVPLVLYLYVFAYTLGVLPLCFVLGGELFPHEVRGVMNGLYGSAGYLYAAISSKFFPDFLTNFGIKLVLWIFTLFSFLSFGFSYLFVPETKGKSLIEVQEQINKEGIFGGKKLRLIRIRDRGYGTVGRGIG